jgi:hypothetical protein
MTDRTLQNCKGKGYFMLDDIRDSSGELPAYAWPGGYPILYLDKDNSILCPNCANDSDKDGAELPDFKPSAYFIHWEGSSIFCDYCSDEVESAYGDPDEEERGTP